MTEESEDEDENIVRHQLQWCSNGNCLIFIIVFVNMYAKQKHLGCKKSARPIRSNMQAGRHDQKL